MDGWLEVAGAGMTLVSCNAKIRGVDDEARFFENEGPQILQIVVETRKRLLAKQAYCEMLASTVSDDQKHIHEPLLQLAVPEAFLTELKSERLDDILSWKFAAVSESLRAAMTDLNEQATARMQSKRAPTYLWQDLLTSVRGPRSWTASLAEEEDPSTVSLEQLHAAATSALFPFAPGKLLKNFADQAEDCCYSSYSLLARRGFKSSRIGAS